MSKNENWHENWSRFILELAALSDEDLMSESAKTTLTVIAARSEYARAISKEHLPFLEKSASLMVDEMKRRGLKNKDMMI